MIFQPDVFCLDLQRSLKAQPTSRDVKLTWCLASGKQAGHVLRTTLFRELCQSLALLHWLLDPCPIGELTGSIKQAQAGAGENVREDTQPVS